MDIAHSVGASGRPHKREAVLAGALSVFARDGYARASIDDIAAAAWVSTRTIYNHFVDKATLFHEVIVTSARVVADAQIAVMDEHLADLPTDAAALERVLTAFAHAWLAPVPEHERHFELVRQINAELAHIPVGAVEAWQETGPRGVMRALTGQFRRYAKAGLMTIEQPELAARQFAVLINPVTRVIAQRTAPPCLHRRACERRSPAVPPRRPASLSAS